MSSQTITTLDWNELRIDSVLPIYTEVVPLESDYRLYDYKVNIEYPEWAPLTTEEARRVKRTGQSVDSELHVTSSLGISRKHGVLDIAFCPIVLREGKYYKLLNASITITPRPKPLQVRRASASLAQRYARNSVLSRGQWVKISITEDGIYRLTRTALKKMGFAHPDNVRLYGHGGHRLAEVSRPETEYDDLEEVPLYKAGNDTWLFWGNGLLYWEGNTRVINPYATAACYFLTEGESPAEIGVLDTDVQPTDTVDAFADHVLYEKDEYAWFHGGRNLYENTNYANSNSHTYRLSTHSSLGGESLTVVFTAAEDSRTEVVPTVNGQALSALSMSSLGQYMYATSASRTTDVSAFSQGSDWTVRLTSTSGHNARLDYLALHYNRSLTPYQGYVAFTGRNASSALFRIAGSGLVVMRIGQPGDAAAIMRGHQNGAYYQVAVDDASRRYVAFDPQYEFPQPTVVGSIDNQNLHALDSLDMVIIVPSNDKLTAQAQRLAEAHAAYDGLRTAVVRADQVYNEFSSGTPDATAYRRLMKMLYDRAESDDQMPRYLLLFGDAAWDNRMLSTAWRNTSPDDYLLSFQSENSFSDTQSYVMEDYFGLLDDGEGANLTDDKVDLGIGRFPVKSVNEAKMMVDKTIRHLSNAEAGDWKNVVMVLGDDGDENEHLWMADTIANQTQRLNPQMDVRKVMWDAYERVSTLTSNTYPEVTNIIRDQMDKGVLIMNYTGHAATYCLSHEFVLKLEDFANFRGTRLPLWVTAACDVMPFDGRTENVGETAILNENGAAVAFYGTTRTVYASNNLPMNRWFMRYVLGTDAAGRRYRVGDAIRLAKNYIIDGRLETYHVENKLHYALLGDPALTFGAPVNRVVLDSINGVAVGEGGRMQLRAGEHVHMAGHLASDDGAALTGFTGTVSARVYDNVETIVCKNNAGAKKGGYEFTNRDKVLFSGMDSVRAGVFAMDFVMPVDINFSDEAGRVVFYAINTGRDVEANGYSEDFTVGGISPQVGDDDEGPQIYAWLNDEDFENGGRVNATPYFVAQLYDDNGINYSGGGLGHNLLLTIDNDASQSYVLDDYYTGELGDYTRGTVAFSIPRLADGPHTLAFRAWDMLNNTRVATLDFVVDGSLKPVVLNLAASQNPALTTTNFLVSYNMPGTDCDLLIEVFDFAGRRLWSHSLTANSGTGLCSVPWNLTTSSGGRLGAGVYLYRATLRSGTSKKVSKSQKIIIHGNN